MKNIKTVLPEIERVAVVFEKVEMDRIFELFDLEVGVQIDSLTAGTYKKGCDTIVKLDSITGIYNSVQYMASMSIPNTYNFK